MMESVEPLVRKFANDDEILEVMLNYAKKQVVHAVDDQEVSRVLVG